MKRLLLVPLLLVARPALADHCDALHWLPSYGLTSVVQNEPQSPLPPGRRRDGNVITETVQRYVWTEPPGLDPVTEGIEFEIWLPELAQNGHRPNSWTAPGTIETNIAPLSCFYRDTPIGDECVNVTVGLVCPEAVTPGELLRLRYASRPTGVAHQFRQRVQVTQTHSWVSLVAERASLACRILTEIPTSRGSPPGLRQAQAHVCERLLRSRPASAWTDFGHCTAVCVEGGRLGETIRWNECGTGIDECASVDLVEYDGCADGQREGMLGEPDVAACSGGFQVSGLRNSEPSCNREGGDDGTRPDGDGCAASDLCAQGWKVCSSSAEVLRLTDDRGCVRLAAEPGVFYASAQSTCGLGVCCPDGVNDFAGCGSTERDTRDRPVGCEPLNALCGEDCRFLSGEWACGDEYFDRAASESFLIADNTSEANRVVKSGSAGGGVLCCRDER